MNDLKITISRGYTRKINLGNYIKTKPYESVDFFANYAQEFPADTPVSNLKARSEELYSRAKVDVEDAVASYLMEEINNLPRKGVIKDKTPAKYEFESDLQVELEESEADKDVI